jgi:ribosomal protein L37AE/L43A
MALIKCKDCRKEISTAAPTCPHCGRPSTVQQIDSIIWGAVKGGALLLVGGTGLFVILALKGCI